MKYGNNNSLFVMPNNPSKILGIIPCTKSKIWDKIPDIGPVFAENAYTNPFHSLAKAYISIFTNNWVIFSAKYGFLNPKDVIDATYDVTFDRPDDPHVTISELDKQVIDKHLNQYTDVIVVCNNRYVDIVKKVFKKINCKIHIPFNNIEDNSQGSILLNQHLFNQQLLRT